MRRDDSARVAVDQLLGKDLHEVAVFDDLEVELGGVHCRRPRVGTDDLDVGLDLRALIRRRDQAEDDSLGVFATHPATDGGRGPGALEDLDVVPYWSERGAGWFYFKIYTVLHTPLVPYTPLLHTNGRELPFQMNRPATNLGLTVANLS